MNNCFSQIREWQPALTGFCIILALLTPAHPAWAAPDERPSGTNRLIAIIPKDGPPSFYRDRTTGKAAGFAVDISNEVAKRAGFSLSYKFGDNWDEIREAIVRGEADVGPGLSVSAARKGYYLFSEPFEIFTISFFARSAGGSPELKDGASVGVVRGSVAYELIRARRDMTVYPYDNFQAGLFDLLAGRIDAFAGPAPVLRRLAMDAGVEGQIKVIGEPIAEVRRAFGVRKDRAELVEQLNKALQGFVGSAEYQKIYAKWYGKPRPYFALSRQAVLTAIILSIVIVAMAAWRHLSVMGLTRRLRREIEEHKRTEEALSVSEESYRVLFDQDPLPGWIYDAETFKFLLVNSAAQKHYGYSREEFNSMTIKNIRPVEDVDKLLHFSADISGKPAVSGFWRHQKKDGSLILVEINSHPVLFNGKVARRVIVKDVTESKKAEEALRISEARLREITDNMVDMVAQFDEKAFFLYVSPSYKKVLGYRSEELVGTWAPGLLHPDDQVNDIQAIDSMLRSKTDTVEFRFRHKDGSYRWIESTGRNLMNAQGQAIGSVMGSRDISDRKRAEALVLRSLQEKEVLLKEVHHRVKNNMQVIYSLLNLQAKSVADSTVRAMFEESRNRVNSMSLIHEKLYRSADLAHVDFKEYLQNLVGGIADTYKRRDVVLSVNMEPLALDVNIGIPCGLIVNELVSNSLKYAFPEERPGSVTVGIRKKDEGMYVLSVADNGIGFPETVDFRNTPSLGLQLVIVLTGQIQGTIELSKEAGTTFSIIFPGAPESKGEQNG